MKRNGLFALIGAGLLAACTTTTPGTGWSRAPDLSVYSAMTLFGDIAYTEAALCGYSRTMEGGNWREDFAAREQAVVAGLVARHGAEAVDAAEAAAVASRRVYCPDVPVSRWRDEYTRLLYLLEYRLGLG